MSSISANRLTVDINNVQKLNTSTARKATPEELAKFQKIQELMYTSPVNLQDHVSQKVYAEVKVNGKTVVTIDNGGSASGSSATFGKISNLPSMGEKEKLLGPALAQKRAEEIAAALGGKIVKASTAVTPAQYMAAPPIVFRVDYAAMERDRKIAEAQAESATTKVNTQIIAQTPEFDETQAS